MTSSVDFKVRERTSVVVVDELCDSQVFLFCSSTVFEKTNRGDRPQPEQPCRRIKIIRYEEEEEEEEEEAAASTLSRRQVLRAARVARAR